jgi:hypothetical protein
MAGTVLYLDTSAGVTTTGPGITGQVLTSQGPGVAPIFAPSGIGTTTAFQAYLSNNTAPVTGDSTVYQIIFDTVVRNDSSIYNNSTGLVTFNQSGLWYVNSNVTFAGILVANLNGNIYFQNQTPVQFGFLNYGAFPTSTSSGEYGATNSALIPVTAGDTLGVFVIYDGNGSKNVNVQGTDLSITSFSGFFVGSNALTAAYSYTLVNSTPYTVLLTDQYLGVDCSGAAITLLFPDAPSTGQYWTIKDVTGSAATNNITITTVSGTDTFDGSTSVILSQNYGSLTVLFNGTSYEVS